MAVTLPKRLAVKPLAINIRLAGAMNKYSKGAQHKIEETMEEFKQGKLKSGGSKKVVKNRKQAIAIGISKAREAGHKVPPAS